MRRRSVFALSVAVLGGLFATYIDFRQTEVQSTILAVLVTALVAGAIDSRLAWLTALLVPACLAAGYSILPHFGISPAEDCSLGSPRSLMVLAVPAALSAYAGAGLRRTIR
ncbi:MAG TPA: hypothetical protein VK604_16165 [Bryobacteraceae bacterium]|nr:hypothetical protein [Bryobacteraceae bacterium]